MQSQPASNIPACLHSRGQLVSACYALLCPDHRHHQPIVHRCALTQPNPNPRCSWRWAPMLRRQHLHCVLGPLLLALLRVLEQDIDCGGNGIGIHRLLCQWNLLLILVFCFLCSVCVGKLCVLGRYGSCAKMWGPRIRSGVIMLKWRNSLGFQMRASNKLSRM